MGDRRDVLSLDDVHRTLPRALALALAFFAGCGGAEPTQEEAETAEEAEAASEAAQAQARAQEAAARAALEETHSRVRVSARQAREAAEAARSDPEDVRRARVAYEAEGWDPDDVRPRDAAQCVQLAEHFADVRVFGSFAHDHGCRLLGVFVEERYYPTPRAAVPAILARAGWAGADRETRVQLALQIVREVLNCFDHVDAPVARADGQGGVRVRFQTQHTGMRSSTTSRHSYRFSRRGRVSR